MSKPSGYLQRVQVTLICALFKTLNKSTVQLDCVSSLAIWGQNEKKENMKYEILLDIKPCLKS